MGKRETVSGESHEVVAIPTEQSQRGSAIKLPVEGPFQIGNAPSGSLKSRFPTDSESHGTPQLRHAFTLARYADDFRNNMRLNRRFEDTWS
jgi:hypothetical protein